MWKSFTEADIVTAMAEDDDLAESFVTDDPDHDLNCACYAVSDSLAYDDDASFLSFKLKAIVKIRGIKNFNSKEFGAALFECFKQPDIGSEILDLQSNQKQLAVVPSENRETGIDPSDRLTAKIPASIRERLQELRLSLDIVPQRPPISLLIGDGSTVH